MPVEGTSSGASGASAWHALASGEAIRNAGAEPDGLSSDEAARRLTRHGPNALPESKGRSVFMVFLRQFASPLIYILVAAAVFAFVVGEARDAAVILAVLVANALIGAFQEGRAQRSMEALRQLSALQARVLRDGNEVSVPARDLVPGDILLLAAGDSVGADARLLEAAALEAAEAALTGESLPVAKHPEPLPADTALADRKNMVYSGTHVVSGRGRAVIVATGTDTEVGEIASLTGSAGASKTPLEQRIAQFGRYLVVAAILLFLAVLALGWMRGLPFGEILMVAISQMVSMVPEGLPVAMTIALAVGMQRMAAKRAVVRRLAAVETLGSTSVICSDKTGTLTKNEMTVTDLWLPGGRKLAVTGAGYSPEGGFTGEDREIAAGEDAGLRSLLVAATLCNDARLVPPDDEDPRWRSLGDPTEAALITLAMKGGVDPEELRREWPRRAEIPFDSSTKMMATRHVHADKRARVFLKGAPEVLLDLCARACVDGEPRAFDDSLRDELLAASDEFAGRALRLLAIAEADTGELDADGGFEPFRGRLVFLGLVGETDPPREEVKEAVAECRSAGIRPVMVTGDHKATGLAVARALGIAREGDRAVDGPELEGMSEHDLRRDIDRISVFARVHPAQKVRIVEAFQAREKVVAMTGDGVNDAPALARADVGVAMGITGTEVAKGAAEIVITDDNFATIISAVKQGRLVYRNLKKVILFLFATSIDEVVVLLLALLFDYPLPLAAVQILWINIVTEGVLTVNLVMERDEGDEMSRPPIPSNEPLVDRMMWQRMAVMVSASVVAVFGFFVWRHSTGVPLALLQTETFTVLTVCQWFNVLNCRSDWKSSLNFGLFRNPWLVGGLVLGNLLHLLVIYTEPMNHTFRTVPIPLRDFFLIGAVASLVLWAEELRKLWFRARMRRAGLSGRVYSEK